MSYQCTAKIVIKKLLLVIFLTSATILIICFLGELIFRIKYLGTARAIQSILHQSTPPSVLGTNNWMISDPDLGFRLNPAQPGVNSLSMKDKEIMIPKPPGLIRIVVLGDSLPYSGDPTFVQLLQNKFGHTGKVEVINASIPGYTTYQELIFLKKFLIKTEPDFVILSYCLNDNYKFLHRFDKNANMLWTQEGEDSFKINNAFDAFINKSYFLTTIKIMFIGKGSSQKKSIFPWENEVAFNIAWKDYAWPDFSDRLNTMNNILKQHNAKLYIVIFPLEEQLNQDLLHKNYQYVTKPQREVAFYGKKFGIPSLDLFQLYYTHEQKDEKLYISDGIHLSTDGHILAANSIYAFLQSDAYFRSRVK